MTHLSHAQVRHGSETTVRVVLNYNRAGHEARLPPTLYVKGQWTPRALQQRAEAEAAGKPVTAYGIGGEARFYQDVAPLLPDLNVPYCHFATVGRGGTAIVTEDLYARNVVLGSAGASFEARDRLPTGGPVRSATRVVDRRRRDRRARLGSRGARPRRQGYGGAGDRYLRLVSGMVVGQAHAF